MVNENTVVTNEMYLNALSSLDWHMIEKAIICASVAASSVLFINMMLGNSLFIKNPFELPIQPNNSK